MFMLVYWSRPVTWRCQDGLGSITALLHLALLNLFVYSWAKPGVFTPWNHQTVQELRPLGPELVFTMWLGTTTMTSLYSDKNNMQFSIINSWTTDGIRVTVWGSGSHSSSPVNWPVDFKQMCFAVQFYFAHSIQLNYLNVHWKHMSFQNQSCCLV